MQPTTKVIVAAFVAVATSVGGWLWKRGKQRRPEEKQPQPPLDAETGAIVLHASEKPAEIRPEPHTTNDDRNTVKSLFFTFPEATCEVHTAARKRRVAMAIFGQATLLVVDARERIFEFLGNTTATVTGASFHSEGLIAVFPNAVFAKAPFVDFVTLVQDCVAIGTPISAYPALVECWFQSWGVRFPPGFLPYRMASFEEAF